MVPASSSAARFLSFQLACAGCEIDSAFVNRANPNLVSVVVPVFDRVVSLQRAVSSVLAQSEVDLEVLVIDDASTVDLRDVVRDFGDLRVRYVRRATNGGVSAAQNTGVAHAAGEFVAFLHSDDEYLEDALRCRVEAMSESGGDVCAVQTGARFADGDASPILRGVTFDRLLGSQVAAIHISPFLFRTNALRSEPFDERLRSYEDYDVLLRLLRRFTFVFEARVTTVIHADQQDRLSASQGTSLAAVRYLFNKYSDELAQNRKARSTWNFKLARLASLCGEDANARRHLLQSVRDDPRRFSRLMLLFTGPERDTWSWRTYRRASSMLHNEPQMRGEQNR
jgi:glycosyltransferase involved in cell wall biosynthesis